MTIARAKNKTNKQMKRKQGLERVWSNGSAGKESTLNSEDAGDLGSIPGFDPWVGKIPGGGNGNPLQYSCRENSMDRGAWWATVHGIMKSRTQLNKHSSWSMSLGHTVTLV